MRNIYSILVLLLMSISSYGQIFGPGTVRVGNEFTFSVSPPNSFARYQWHVTQNGRLKATTSSAYSLTCIATAEGYGSVSIEFYDKNGRLITIEREGVTILPDLDAPVIVGPMELKPNSTYQFIGSSPIKTASLSWDFPKEYFESLRIDRTNPDYEVATINTKDFKLENEPILGSITLKGFTVDKTRIGTHYFKFSLPSYEILPSTSVACETVSYKLINYEEGDNIVWSSPTMTIVSGQGTNNATFKRHAGFNGYGTVKCIIKSPFGANPLQIENNAVWIGGPLVTIKPIGNPNFQAGKSYEFEALLQGDDGATSLKWNIQGDASVRPKLFLGDRSTAMVDLFQNRNGGSFRVYVDLTSSGGCKAQSGAYAGSFSGTGGGLIDPPTGIEDPNQGIGKPYSSFSRDATSLLLTPQYKEIEILSFPNGILIKRIKNVSSFDINNYDLTPGIYLIRYKDQENNVTTEKVKL